MVTKTSALCLVLYSPLLTSASALLSTATIHGQRSRPSPPIRLQIFPDNNSAQNQNDATRKIDELLWNMIRFFGDDMIDTDTNRFYYFCYPQRGECEHVHHPIRDLAAAWDGCKALQYLEHSPSFVPPHASIDGEEAGVLLRVRQQLNDAIRCTLSVYQSQLNTMNTSQGVYLHEDVLLESPTIGHSALLLLGLCNSYKLPMIWNERGEEEIITKMIDRLAQGILSMQLENGAFNIEFGDESHNYLNGIEFFPGEAMLSLMSAYELATTGIMKTDDMLEESTTLAILAAMERAFDFYSGYYYNDDNDVGINFNIWQVQAFAMYHDALLSLSLNSNNQPLLSQQSSSQTRRDEVKKYVLDMCQGICNSRSWRHELSRGQSFYINLETVEIACGLDALAEGMRTLIAQERQMEGEEDEDPTMTNLARLFKMHTTNGVYFLEWVQAQVPESCTVGRGGLGFGGVQVFEQRLDVTGHAISALVKLAEMGP